MVSRLTHPDDSRPSSSGWDVASLLLLLGVAVTCEYLFPGDETRTTSPPSAPRSHWADRRALDNDGRGRHATAPSKIPARGWKDILLRVYANISKHRILALAAGMTYYSILAIFPAIAALVAVYGLFSDPSTIARHLDQLGGFLPGGAIDVAREQLTRVASKESQALGLTFLSASVFRSGVRTPR